MKTIRNLIILCVLFSITSYAHNTPYTLRIATYNLFWKNGVCKPYQFNITADVIKKINADIILLQETTPSWKKCLDRELSHIYPHRKYKHNYKAGGLAILSKHPIQSRKFIYSKKYLRYPAWLISADTNIGRVNIMNLHLSPSVNKNNKIGFMGIELFKGPGVRHREMSYLLRYVSPKSPTILAGDFNEGYGGATQMLKYNGWHDALSVENKNTYTWKWKVGPFSIKQIFDRVFLSPQFRVIKSRVIHDGISDHYPVVIDLMLRKNTKW